MDLKDLTKIVDEHTDELASHNSRLCSVEINRGMVEVQIQNLIKSMDNLTDSIKLMLFGALGIGVGFIIWYLQKL